MKAISFDLLRHSSVRIRWVSLVVIAAGSLWISGNHSPAARADIASIGREVERWDTYPPESEDRYRTIGRLLYTLKPGMTRQQVEAIIGPPNDRRDDLTIDWKDPPLLTKYYDCRPPQFEPFRPGRFCTMQVVYDVTGPVPLLVKAVYTPPHGSYPEPERAERFKAEQQKIAEEAAKETGKSAP
jgi:hypothetical protein